MAGVSTANVFDLLDDEPRSASSVQAKSGKSQSNKAKSSSAAAPTRGAPATRGGAAARGASTRGGASSRGGGGASSGDDIAQYKETSHGDGTKREFDRHSARGGARGGGVKKGGAALGDPLEIVSADPESGVPHAHHAHPPTDGEHASSKVKAADSEETEPVAVSAEDAIEELEEIEPEPLGYDEFLAQKAAKRCQEDEALQIRMVQVDDKEWNKVKPLQKVSDKAAAAAAEATRAEKAKGGKNKKGIMNIDEFVASGPVASGRPQREEFQGRGGFRGESSRGDRPQSGGRGGGRGGRGGFSQENGAPRGGAAAGADRGAPRGGRGGAFRGASDSFRGERGAYRGGNQRGGSFTRGASRGVNVNDESAFPKLG